MNAKRPGQIDEPRNHESGQTIVVLITIVAALGLLLLAVSQSLWVFAR